MENKGRDKEETDIETLTHLVKNLTIEVSKLKLQKTDTFARSRLSRQRQENSSSSSKWFASITMQTLVFQLEYCTYPRLCSIHEERHLENSCSDWKKFFSSICSHKLNVERNMQEKLEDTSNDEDVAPDETSSYGHVVNAYQCSQVILKTNTKKQPQKKNDHYNIRIKGAPHTLG